MWSVFKGLMVFKLHRGRRSVPPGRLLLSSTFPCKDTSLLGVSFRGCGLNIKSTLRSSHFAFLNVRPLALLWTFWLFPEVIKSWWIFRCSTSISWDSLKRLKLLRCLQEFTVVTYRQQCIVGYYRKWKPHTRCMLSWHYALKKKFLVLFLHPSLINEDRLHIRSSSVNTTQQQHRLQPHASKTEKLNART